MITVSEKVRFAETDAMGVVHHANYLRWFEMGRVEYLRRAGVFLNDLMSDGILFPITDVSSKYIMSAKFDDDIVIETTMRQFTRVKMIFSYRVIRAKDEAVLAIGKTQNVFTNASGQVTRLPLSYYEKLAAYCKDDVAKNKA